MGGRGVIAITTWVVATLIVVSLAWVAVSHAVAGIADPIPNIMGHGKGGAHVALRPALDKTSKVRPAPGATPLVSAASIVPSGAAAALAPIGRPLFTGPIDPATVARQQVLPGSLLPAPGGGQGTVTARPVPPSSPATAPAGGHAAGGTTVVPPGAGTAVPPPAPTTTTAPNTARSFGTAGGTVTVRCTGDSIALVSATPQSGYTTDVGDPGPDNVDVNFASSSHEYDMQVVCQGGIPAGSVDG